MKRAQNPHTESGKPRRGRGFRKLLERWIAGPSEEAEPRRGRLLLESLEKRQLLAGDVDLFATDGNSDSQQPAVESTTSSEVSSQAEGEPAPDLVQFAQDLLAAGVVYFGAEWCPACTQQKELFEDGGNDLNMIEVTDPDARVARLTDPSVSILNSVGVANNITSFPTWVFPDGSRAVGVQSLQELSTRSGVPIPQSEDPTFEQVGDQTVLIGSPLHIPIDAYDPDGGPLTVTVSVEDPTLLEATVLQGNRSIRVNMQGYGDMVYELFEQRAPTATGRIVTLAESDFYDGVIFHRIADGFVIQGGDPTGTGTSGSNLGTFDDDFHPDLQHNREGVLSFAKAGDDTNNSQFFVTEVPTRFLDFNHSVFGQLVEGFDVREAISTASTPESRFEGSSQRPEIDIVMDSVEVFTDTENSVVMLKATGTGVGTTNVTFTVTDQDGNTHSETVAVTVGLDNANSQPFLNPITDPATTPVNTPAQLQLSSVDVEGDAVTYFAQSLSGAGAGTVAVDSTTGLVTVTPANGFSGTIDVSVGVRPGPGITGNGPTDQDTQRVSFTFEGEQALAPTFVDLLAGSDSGTSDSDDITNEGTLSFLVGGVVDGATVEIINTANGSVVGTGLASGATVTITTNNIAALGDGTYDLAARQTVGSVTSPLSPALTLQYDTVAPDSVADTALTQANVGREFFTDLISSEEGSGLIYGLSAAPTGAVISSDTGIIQWTPDNSQLGANTFTLDLTDAAGNTRSESITVNVLGAPLAEIRLDLRDLQGNPIDSVAVGDEFLLDIVAVDARNSSLGVFAAYADILFDSQLLQVVPGSVIDFNDDFPLVRKGTFQNGLIDEVGAVRSTIVATGNDEDVIATIRMEALATGTVTVRSEPADENDSEFLIFGEDERIPADSIAFGGTTLTIGQSFIINDDLLTVAEDSGQTSINVLANDQVISGSAALSVVSVSQPAEGGTVTRSGNTVQFTPDADFNGTTTFTYLAGDTNGVQSTGTVTINVSAVNDPPTATNDAFDVVADSTNNTLDLLNNDLITPDTGETLSITSVNQPSNGGTVTITNGGANVQYTPASGFTGAETFTYTIDDGGLSSTATVTVTVAPTDDPPSANDDTFNNLTEDDPETALDVLSNDQADINNETFVIQSVGTPDQGGTVRISDDSSQLLYTPAADFNGDETFTYTIRDEGGGLSVATVTVTVAAVDDPPPIDDLTVNVNRANGPTIIFTISDLPSNVDANETLSISDFDAATTSGGTVQQVNGGDSLQYTLPSDDFTGTDTLTYEISDGVTQSTGTITINVTDFTTRNVVLNLPDAAIRHRVTGTRIVGTNRLGEPVDQPIQYDNDVALFENLLPGDYMIEIPAIPFLQGGDEARQIPFTSNPEDGDGTVDADLGLIKPEFLSIRDWLGSSSRNSVFVVVEPGVEQRLTIPLQDVNDDETPNVEFDANAQSVTIRRTIDVVENDVTFQRDQVATVPLDTNGSVEVRGVIDQQQLLRIDLEDLVFTDAPASSSAEGEPISLNVGTALAEGESVAAGALTQADVLAPPSSNDPSQTEAAVLVTEESDLWVAESEPVEATGQQAVDSAMQDVSDQLVISQSAGDDLNDDQMDELAIDEALGGELF